MQHGQLGGLLLGRIGDVLSPAHDHAVAAGGFLHVEPQIFTAGGVQGELIVLQVVAAHQNFKAVAGHVPQEVRRFLLAIPLLVVFQIALALQLGADLVERSLHQQLLQHGVGGLLLFIVAEIFLRVLIGTKARVQLDGDILAGVVVLHGHLAVALVYSPEVGLQQLTVQAQRIGLGGLGQFLAAGGLLADGTVVHVVHSLVQ